MRNETKWEIENRNRLAKLNNKKPNYFAELIIVTVLVTIYYLIGL